MHVNDPISDLLTRIRNAQLTKHEVVAVPASKVKIAITHILKQEGFIRDYKCVRDSRQGMIKIALKYDDMGKGVIREIDRVSRPSRRVYWSAADLPYFKGGYGVGVVSTSRGIMSDREARSKKLGGEYLCRVF